MAGFKFRRQCPIGPYIVDFICFEKMLVLEIDGGQHALQIQKDAQRTEFLMSRGFKVMRFWNNEVLTETDLVLGVILAARVSSPSSPTLLPWGEGGSAMLTESVGDIRLGENKYSPSPNGRGQG